MKRELTVEENLTFWAEFMAKEGAAPLTSTKPPKPSVSPASPTSPSATSPPASTPHGHGKLLVAHRPVWIWTSRRRRLIERAMRCSRGCVRRISAEGGMLIAATHQPLGIEDVKTLVMKGFEYGD